MVKLLSSFIRKITQKGATTETAHSNNHEERQANTSSPALSPVISSPVSKPLDISGHSGSGATSPRPDSGFANELYEHGVTSNIVTVALGDWGYPALEPTEHKHKLSGKYITGLLRNYVNHNDALEGFIAASKISNIPKVEESDFSEYIRQISVLYITMEENAFYGESSEHPKSSYDTPDLQVPKDYYNENYDIAKNEILKRDLEEMPAIMSNMERQLSAVNGELQDLLEMRYGHVNEACMSVEELYKRFMDVTNQISQIRTQLEGGTVKTDPVQTEQEQASSLIDKEEVDWILEAGIERKRSLQSILDQLHLLRAVAHIPEYIQGIADSNGMALAIILGEYATNYLRVEMSQFKLAQSVASVLSETLSNMGRVVESKFVNLAQVALLEASNYPRIKDGVEYLQSMLNKLHQPLIALLNSSALEAALQTLEKICNNAKAAFEYNDYYTREEILESFHTHASRLSSFILLSQVWGCMLLRHILCVLLGKANNAQTLPQEDSIKLIRKLIRIIRERLSSATSGGAMASISHISSSIRESISLPQLCNGTIDHEKLLEARGLEDDETATEVEEDIETPEEETDPYVTYMASVKRTMCSVAYNTFETFTKSFIFTCNLPVDFEVYDFVSFIDGFKSFKEEYNKLLSEIKANKVFEKMLSVSLSEEIQSNEHIDNSICMDISNMIGQDECEALLEQFRHLADEAICSVFKSCLEPLKLSNIMSMQNMLAGEMWEEFKLHEVSEDGAERTFSLVMSTFSIDERLKLYPLLMDAMPSSSEDVAQDCVQLLSLYNSLLDVETSTLQSLETDLDDATIRKSCLMVESLRFFSRRITSIASHVLETPESAETESEHSSTNNDSSYNTAENCSDHMDTLKQRILHALSNDIVTKMKRHMLLWVLQSPDDEYDDQGLKEMVNVIRRSLDIIQPVLRDITDIQIIFEIAFQHLHANIPREEIDIRRVDEFRDSCMELITGLSEYNCIKLEVCWLADTLSNELFNQI